VAPGFVFAICGFCTTDTRLNVLNLIFEDN